MTHLYLAAFHSLSGVLQFQLVERTAAVADAGRAADAAIDGDSDEIVPVQHHTVIWVHTICIGSRGCISCTKGVQNLEAAVFLDAVKHAVAIRTPGEGVRVQSPMRPGSEPAIRGGPVPILAGRVHGAEVVHNLDHPRLPQGITEHDTVAIGSTITGCAIKNTWPHLDQRLVA